MFLLRTPHMPTWRIAFWLGAALVAVLAWLQCNPIEIAAEETRQAGRPASIAARGDVLLLVDSEGIRRAAAEGRFERSWAWTDVFRQEVGPVSVAEATEFSPELLRKHRILVVSQSAGAHPLLAERAGDLEAWVTSGGILVLELPSGNLRSTFAGDGLGGWRVPAAVTAVTGVAPESAEILRRMPLMTRYLGNTRPPPNVETLMAMDGAPVVYARTLGEGDVIVFEFDLAAQLSALQQGLPGPGGEVVPRRSGHPIHTSDLVASPQLVGAAVPWADVLERFVVHTAIAWRQPVFALWPFPRGGLGALVTSHDARSLEGAPLWMSEHERRSDVRAVTFLPATAPPGGAIRVSDRNNLGLAALLWVIDPGAMGLYRPHGILGFYPVIQPLTLGKQLEQLKAALGGKVDIRGVRIDSGAWTSDPVDPWRAMDSAGLRYSATYGPALGAPMGYQFGTCQPFTPLDSDGMPFRVQEVPVCFLDPETARDTELLGKFLGAAAANRWAVHLLTASDRFQRAPSMRHFDAWRDAIKTAGAEKMWIGGPGELVAFWRDRSAAEVKVINRQVLSRTDDGSIRSIEWTVEAETNTRDLVLMIPERAGPLRFGTVNRVSGQGAPVSMADRVEAEVIPYAGRDFRIIPLNPGFTTVGIRYVR